MKYTKKIMVIFLAAVFVATLCSFEALAKREETGGDSPPFGLKIEGGNKGDKFEGVVDVEWYERIFEYTLIEERESGHPCEYVTDWPLCCTEYKLSQEANAVPATARVTVRIRKGSEDFIVFVSNVPIADTLADDAAIQAEIVSAIKCALVEAIYEGAAECNALTIGLKAVKDFGALEISDADDIMGEANPIIDGPFEENGECHVPVGGSNKILMDVVINIF